MDQQIERVLGTIHDFERLQNFEANVIARKAMTPEVEAALKVRGGLIARAIVAEQTGLDLSELTPAEELVVRAVSEYLGMKKRQGRGAAYTLRQLKSQGLIGAVEASVSRSSPTQGFETLKEEDREDISYEQIVVDHPEEFSPRALWYSNRTLGRPTDGDRPPARSGIPVQIRTEDLLAWLRNRAASEEGHIAVFTNAEAAATIGMTDLVRQGRAYGNIQSRLDFACYRAGLPPLGLTADRPFAEAWQQEDRTWGFPVAGMQATAQAFRWRDPDFDALVEETRKLSGRAYVLWRAEIRDNEQGIQTWAEGLA